MGLPRQVQKCILLKYFVSYFLFYNSTYILCRHKSSFLKEGIPTRKSWQSKKKILPSNSFKFFLKSTPGFWLRCVIVGRQYDSKGKLKDWWEPYTVELFRETTTCMKDQYNGFKLEGLQVSVTGSVKSLYNSLSSGTFTMNC